MRTRALTTLVLILVLASLAAAQRGGRRGGGFGQRSYAYATVDDFDGSFQFCRVVFRQASNGDGGNWSVDFPRADQNLSIRLSELTKTPVGFDADAMPKHLLVSLRDPLALSHCAFIMMTEVGSIYLDDDEAANLRNYLLKGGFLWADDFWGERAFDWWAGQIGKAFPPERYPIVDVPLEHELFHVLYDIKHIPQIPSIDFWAYSGQTSERGADSAVPHVRAIMDDTGRIMVLMTHNTDFGDAFEREGDDHRYFLKFAPDGYAFGVNALVYSMTH